MPSASIDLTNLNVSRLILLLKPPHNPLSDVTGTTRYRSSFPVPVYNCITPSPEVAEEASEDNISSKRDE